MTSIALSGVETTTGFGRALHTFQRAAQFVPAYRDFLAIHDVDARSIRTPADFDRIPPVTKENYLKRYPLDMLTWNGEISRATMWSTSSGSSGRPTYWPRDLVAAEESIDLHGRIFRQSFHSHYRSTLVVVAFAMGNWIAGGYTQAAVTALAARGHRVSVITPGIDVPTILDNIERLAPLYDQVVLVGYPPFVKDVLDQATRDILTADIKILLAGETITEEWRDYVLERIGKPDHPEDSCLIYGTADMGMVGHETPTTITVRRAARDNPDIHQELFGDAQAPPTFVEYDPNYRYTEVDENGYLLFSADTVVPLIRYRINDQGTLYSTSELSQLLRNLGHDSPIYTSTASSGFLSLHRRTDISTTFYALDIYPENVRAGLEDDGLAGKVSGKFVLSSRSDSRFEQALDLQVELQRDQIPSDALAQQVRALVTESLDRTNAEYRKLHQTLGTRAEPIVTLHPFRSTGFQHSIKHRWNGVGA